MKKKKNDELVTKEDPKKTEEELNKAHRIIYRKQKFLRILYCYLGMLILIVVFFTEISGYNAYFNEIIDDILPKDFNALSLFVQLSLTVITSLTNRSEEIYGTNTKKIFNNRKDYFYFFYSDITGILIVNIIFSWFAVYMNYMLLFVCSIIIWTLYFIFYLVQEIKISFKSKNYFKNIIKKQFNYYYKIKSLNEKANFESDFEIFIKSFAYNYFLQNGINDTHKTLILKESIGESNYDVEFMLRVIKENLIFYLSQTDLIEAHKLVIDQKMYLNYNLLVTRVGEFFDINNDFLFKNENVLKCNINLICQIIYKTYCLSKSFENEERFCNKLTTYLVVIATKLSNLENTNIKNIYYSSVLIKLFATAIVEAIENKDYCLFDSLKNGIYYNCFLCSLNKTIYCFVLALLLFFYIACDKNEESKGIIKELFYYKSKNKVCYLNQFSKVLLELLKDVKSIELLNMIPDFMKMIDYAFDGEYVSFDCIKQKISYFNKETLIDFMLQFILCENENPMICKEDILQVFTKLNEDDRDLFYSSLCNLSHKNENGIKDENFNYILDLNYILDDSDKLYWSDSIYTTLSVFEETRVTISKCYSFR